MASSVPAPSGSVITVASSSSSAAAAAVCGTGSPCAACKFLRRKCQPDCVFAPYFPPDNPQKFVHVHRVFGASNVTKLLNELHPFQREDAVNSLAYEADMRLRDPVYGCVGVISILQQDLARAKYELSKYQAAAAASASTPPTGPQAMAEFIGNAMLNGAHNFINIGHSAALGSLGGSVFGQEQFANAQMLSRSYDGEPIARLGINGGYEFGYSTAMGGSGAVSALDRRARLRMLGLLSIVASIFTTVVLVSLLALHGNARKVFCGLAATIFSICMYASPLSIMRLVIKTKSVEFMPFLLSLAVFLCGTSWFIYGLLGRDPFIIIPNGCGSFLGLVQLILYFIYRKNKGPAAPAGKGETAAAADVEDAKKVAAAVELATTKAAADTVVGDSKVVASQV
ncbi:LOB domain-containing protein 6-like isoform X2 [Miscanthus floridulus]